MSTCFLHAGPEDHVVDGVHVGDAGGPALVVEPNPDVVKRPASKPSDSIV